jgi:hypothetical protein
MCCAVFSDVRVRVGGKRATRASEPGVCVCACVSLCMGVGAPCTAAAGRTNPTGSQRAVTAPKWHAGAPTLTAPCPKYRKTIVFPRRGAAGGAREKKDHFFDPEHPVATRAGAASGRPASHTTR